VTLPPFDLHRAANVEEATELLRRYGDDAAVHCGGTELLLATRDPVTRRCAFEDECDIGSMSADSGRAQSLIPRP